MNKRKPLSTTEALQCMELEAFLEGRRHDLLQAFMKEAGLSPDAELGDILEAVVHTVQRNGAGPSRG